MTAIEKNRVHGSVRNSHVIKKHCPGKAGRQSAKDYGANYMRSSVRVSYSRRDLRDLCLLVNFSHNYAKIQTSF